MTVRRVPVVNSLGLHARAAARFVQLASRFEARVTVGAGGRTMDGKSILGLLLLAAGHGTELVITTDGADEEAAGQALADLTARGFDVA